MTVLLILQDEILSMKLFEILVPTVSNDGRPFRTKHHKVWDSKVLRITNGMTILKPTTKGVWKCAKGNEYVERTIPVRIICSDKEIEEIADWTAKHYKQLAVMYYCVSENVVIKNYQGDK